MATKAKSIRNTFLYVSMNNSGYLDKQITTCLKKGKILSADDLFYEMNTINKYYKFPLKKDILEAVKDGLLKMVVFPKGVEEKIPSSLPFLLTPVQNRIGAYVFIDNIKSYNEKENTYSADPKKLYCLLESAYLAIIFQKNQTVISRSSVACSEGGSIYANMFIRVLNKKYALNVDKRAYAKVLYLASKFFMVNHLGIEASSDTASNYAMKISGSNSPFLVNEIDSHFIEENAYTDLATFIKAIAKYSYLISQSLADLTVRDFITDFVTMYHSSAIFALEHFAYFMFVVDSTIMGAYMSNQAILEDIVDKAGAKLYTQIASYPV